MSFQPVSGWSLKKIVVDGPGKFLRHNNRSAKVQVPDLVVGLSTDFQDYGILDPDEDTAVILERLPE